MVRIALVSDTHLPRFGRRLPAALVEALEAVAPDLIAHLGDHTADFVVEQLGEIAPVEAVAGNNDDPAVVARFGFQRVVDCGGVRVGLTHGHLGVGRTTPDRAAATFSGDAVDVIAFGHSHVPLVGRRGTTLLVNPGSPTDRRRQPAPTWALIETDLDRPPIATIVTLPVVQPDRARCGSSER